MSDAMDVAQAYRDVSEADDTAKMLDLLAEDAELVYPRRTLRGRDEIRAAWDASDPGGPENLDVELEVDPLNEVSDGRIVTANRQIYRWKDSGEVAYERKFAVEYEIRDGKISRLSYNIVERE
jgi:ketosteroid isomerase-like protein